MTLQQGLFPEISVPAGAADAQRVVEAWNHMADRAGLARVRLMSLGRAAHLRKRLADVGLAVMLEAVDRVEASAFCRGDNDRRWKAGFDFILQPKSLTRLLEGGYQARRHNKHEDSTNGAALLLAQLDAETPLIEGNVYESH